MTGERPLVSVITANFNGARHLPAAIRSVLAQTLSSLELIVVDDCSTDDSVAVVQRLAAEDRRIRLVVQPRNGGPGAARNRAIAEANGRWLAVFDSDDLMAPDRLERLVARAEADRADIVADNMMVFQDGLDEAQEAWRPFLAGREFAEPRWIGLAEYIAASKLYVNRANLGYLKPLFCARTLREAGARYNETLRIGEDYDLVLQLLAAGARMRLEPAALYRYRRHGASISQVLRPDHIRAMLAADAPFEAQLSRFPRDVRRAQAIRRRTMQQVMAYEEAMDRLKAGDLKGGLKRAATDPKIWPLLHLPLVARVRRIREKLKPGFASQAAAA